MATDFDRPTISDTHVNIWPQVRDNQTSLARMFSDGGESNIPLRAVRFLNNTLYLWSGTQWDVAPIAVGGGGTGAETAAQARVNLGTNQAVNVNAGVFSADRIPTLSISDKTSGTLDGDRVEQATTSARGTSKLNNTLTSTSTIEALTAAQGKALNDSKAPAASRASPNVSGGEITNHIVGDMVFGIFTDGTGSQGGYWGVEHTMDSSTYLQPVGMKITTAASGVDSYDGLNWFIRSGTWRCLGFASDGVTLGYMATLWIRTN